MKKLWFSVLAIALVGPLAAQPVVQQTISNNEVWPAAQGPGGSSTWLGINTVRNGLKLNTFSGSGAVASTAAGGIMFWVGAAPTSWTVTTPSVAYDGEVITLATDTTLTTLVTLTAAAGQTLHTTYTSQTLTTLVPVAFYFRSANSQWYRTQ